MRLRSLALSLILLGVTVGSHAQQDVWTRAFDVVHCTSKAFDGLSPSQ